LSPPSAATSSQRLAAGRVARPGVAPRTPRRVSGPRAGTPRPRGLLAAPEPLGARVLVGLRALPDHRLLDRLVRGRAWIVLIGGALIGIVAMQVSLLKLNAGIGRDVQRSAVIQRENEALRATNSRLSGGERVQGIAGRMGLTVPAPGSVRFVSPRPGPERR
jgi:hypothetical protein